jgi:glucose dehydrogenase
MSTLKVTNIQATGETASRAVSGVAAVWGSITTNSTLQDSVGVSSLTDVGAGQFKFTFTNAMANATYAASGSACHTSGAPNVGGWVSLDRQSSYTDAVKTSSIQFQSVYDPTPALGDMGYATGIVHGDLA